MQLLKDKLTEVRVLLDASFDKKLALPEGKEKRLVEAMRYSVIGGGKAFRAFLVLTVGEILGLKKEVALQIATALEMVHTYSLIHDDLPAMDNDTMRRGKPTNHIQFDEATAILAGDALLTNAFEVLSDPEMELDAEVRCQLINFLAQMAGKSGMCGGQMLDLIGEKESLSLEEITRLQTKKTGALLRFSVLAPAVAVKANETIQKALEKYAANIGLMFQMTDDILDIEGDEKLMGKTLGKDKTETKSTFITLLGLEETRQRAYQLCNEAKEAISLLGEKATLLLSACDFILERKN
ncbi:MAG: polyprenyl synthetase family protein [Alphaproteobacteria bacterium]|nr:polyprenyl synthetase family protein [Alphaproteobacteria bacterium]